MSDLPSAPEHNPAVLAARFMRALLAESGAVTREQVDARTALPSPTSQAPVRVSVLVPVAALRGWRSEANCAGVDPDLFFPERGGSKVLQARQIEQAKEVCAGCSVRMQCLVDALEGQEAFGIWGGLSERERREFQTKLPRVARCARCGGRFTKTTSGAKFCGSSCPALAARRSRRRAS